MIKEFRDFIVRGNVLDLAVGVIIGAAFNSIVTALVTNIMTPVIGIFTQGVKFDNIFIPLPGGKPIPPEITTYAQAVEGGYAVLGIGAFIAAVINFLIVAFVVFLIVKAANTMNRKKVEDAKPAAPEVTKQEALLTEIRDLLARERS